VYGLGANALNPAAVKSIFTAKGRPLTDPIIVHIADFEKAEELILFTKEVKHVFEILSKKFWPGPITFVMKANDTLIDPILTANTGFLGIRYPNHETAIALIRASGCPIAAPSANKFGHVSPTKASHVYDDFKE